MKLAAAPAPLFRDRLLLALAALATLVTLAACDKPQALGDANALIVGVPEAEWPEIEADVEAALEPRAFTVRDERIFRVTPVDPSGPFWGETRRFRQVLVIGEPADAWIAETLREARHEPSELPAVVEASNVWARGQRVIALVLPPGSSAATALPLLPGVGESIMEAFRRTVRQRMFASGADTVRADTLLRRDGYYLLTPAVYRVQQLDANTIVYINDQPDPAQLQRSILVTWRPSEVAPAADAVLDWRQQLATEHYYPAQVTERERVEQAPFDTNGVAGLQVQGVWSSPPGAWPAGGPFITRVVDCGDGRTFLIDAWVYAPGRDKYEYVLQLGTILDSFRCGARV